jgi:hypothetical protein
MSALSSLTMAAVLRELVTRDELDGALRALALTDNLTGSPTGGCSFQRIDRASQRLSRTPGNSPCSSSTSTTSRKSTTRSVTPQATPC